MPEALEMKEVRRTYMQGGAALEVLRGVNLRVAPGEMVALVGPSGSGKSTLLQIAGLLDTPTAGQVALCGENLSKADDPARTLARKRHLGFVYQFHHLLPEFSAVENVMLPLMVKGLPPRAARVEALELLASLGLAKRATHRPGRLSGGEQQRVAIARAIAGKPALLLADEPTGNLDPHTADEVFALLLKLARAGGMAALVATHNPDLARRMDRVVTLKDGALIG